MSKVCSFISLCSDFPSEGQIALLVIVPVCGVFIIIVRVAIPIGVTVILKRRQRGKNRVPVPQQETNHGRAEDDLNTDSNQSVSNTEHDDTHSDQEAVTETLGGFNNSHPVFN